MNSTHPPVLIVTVSAGLVAALTLGKDPNPRIGQCGTRTWPRFLELFNFLNVPEVNDLEKRSPMICSYKPGTLEPLRECHLDQLALESISEQTSSASGCLRATSLTITDFSCSKQHRYRRFVRQFQYVVWLRILYKKSFNSVVYNHLPALFQHISYRSLR